MLFEGQVKIQYIRPLVKLQPGPPGDKRQTGCRTETTVSLQSGTLSHHVTEIDWATVVDDIVHHQAQFKLDSLTNGEPVE